ncbi:hypothetical protein LXA47_31290 [Massilia sp. P8910]|uniref:hypothetical protein n=1 Tax=Massilia antarctica TaxID=2765360 RepID=UPI001E5AAE5E|nr:hypothetical protein [Massilia antarctica]MCE3608056.1 hypothetical protein [Massilia antarctica]
MKTTQQQFDEIKREMAELREANDDLLCSLRHTEDDLYDLRMRVYGHPYAPPLKVELDPNDEATFQQMCDDLVAFRAASSDELRG